MGELPKTATGYGPGIVLTTDLYNANNLAVDSAGNVFIMEGDHSVVEFRGTTAGYTPTATLPFSGLNFFDGGGIAVSSAGDEVIVADADNNRLAQEQMTGAAWGPQTTLLTGLNFPRGLFLDSAGDVFIANQGATASWNYKPSRSTLAAQMSARPGRQPLRLAARR